MKSDLRVTTLALAFMSLIASAQLDLPGLVTLYGSPDCHADNKGANPSNIFNIAPNVCQNSFPNQPPCLTLPMGAPIESVDMYKPGGGKIICQAWLDVDCKYANGPNTLDSSVPCSNWQVPAAALTCYNEC